MKILEMHARDRKRSRHGRLPTTTSKNKQMDAAGILASRVLHEKQPVTYRVLSRQLSIHVNQAKQSVWPISFHASRPADHFHFTCLCCCRELYGFAQEHAGKVTATYLISGFKKAQKAADSQEEEIAEDVDMKTVATVDTASVPRQVFELVQQDDLEGMLALLL